jgi:hypothetical protein
VQQSDRLKILGCTLPLYPCKGLVSAEKKKIIHLPPTPCLPLYKGLGGGRGRAEIIKCLSLLFRFSPFPVCIASCFSGTFFSAYKKSYRFFAEKKKIKKFITAKLEKIIGISCNSMLQVPCTEIFLSCF